MLDVEADKLAIVLIAFTVAASGCLSSDNSTESASTDSVSIMNFSAYPQQVYNNQQTRLTLQLKNTGEQDAKAVAATLFNVPFTGENSWSFSGSSGQTVAFGTLGAAEPENNLPARPYSETWSLEAPDLPNGVTTPYTFIARVYYKYTTRASSEIVLMSQDRFRQSGKVGRPSLTNTDGPIQLEIRTESPIVFYSEESTRNTEVCVIVRNSGEGTPFLHKKGSGGTYVPGSKRKYSVNSSDINKVNLTMLDQGRIDFTAVDGDSNSAIVELIGSSGIQCFKLKASNWETTSGPQETIPLSLKAEYGYYKEDQTTVTVIGSNRFDS